VTVSLKDKIVLVTGAASGFGADSSRLFARAGATVILADLRTDLLPVFAEEIRVAGGQALALSLDVTELSQVQEAVQTILGRFGRIDILLNNAGIGRLKWLEELDPGGDIEAQVAVNLTGLIQLTRQVLPHMYRQGGGHIINMSSIAGHIASPLYTVYAATKHGVRGFTNALRREAEPFNVRVSGIYPAGAPTGFNQNSGIDNLRNRPKLPGFLTLTSEKVAHCIVHLAQHPRRTVIIPGWYRLVFFLERLLPGLADWMFKVFFVRRFHHPGK
jgi:NADP-dependent 3-hydroxy acid dehydrogenase YdfG